MTVEVEEKRDLWVEAKETLSNLAHEIETDDNRENNAMVSAAKRLREKAKIPLNITAVSTVDNVEKQEIVFITVVGDIGGKDIGSRVFSLYLKSRSEMMLFPRSDSTISRSRQFSEFEPEKIAAGIISLLLSELAEEAAS